MMMYYLETIAALMLALFSYILGRLIGSGVIGQLKHENARLNAELHKLTDRDAKGRFRGGK
jgi:hypothetical protein